MPRATTEEVIDILKSLNPVPEPSAEEARVNGRPSLITPAIATRPRRRPGTDVRAQRTDASSIDQASEPVEQATRARHRRARTALVAAACLLALAGLTTGASLLDGGDETALEVDTSSDDARAAPREVDGTSPAAESSVSTTTAPGAPGPASVWSYSEVETSSLRTATSPTGAEYHYTLHALVRTWVGDDGSTVSIAEPRADIEFLSDRDRQAWIDSGRPTLAGSTPERVETGSDQHFMDEVAALPRDAQAILRQLESVHSDSTVPQISIVEDLVRFVDASASDAALRGALVEAFTLIEDARVGSGIDQIGRRGTSVTLSGSSDESEVVTILIDRDANTLLQVSRSLPEDTYNYRVEPPISIGERTYLQLEATDRPPPATR